MYPKSEDFHEFFECQPKGGFLSWTYSFLQGGRKKAVTSIVTYVTFSVFRGEMI